MLHQLHATALQADLRYRYRRFFLVLGIAERGIRNGCADDHDNRYEGQCVAKVEVEYSWLGG